MGDAECEGWRDRGISGTWNARDPRALAEGGRAEVDPWAEGNIDAEGTDDISMGCTLFLLLFFATSLLMCSAPLVPFDAPKVDCNSDWERFGEGGGVILDAEAAVALLVNVPCEYPSGVGGGTKPNLCKYCC